MSAKDPGEQDHFSLDDLDELQDLLADEVIDETSNYLISLLDVPDRHYEIESELLSKYFLSATRHYPLHYNYMRQNAMYDEATRKTLKEKHSARKHWTLRFVRQTTTYLLEDVHKFGPWGWDNVNLQRLCHCFKQYSNALWRWAYGTPSRKK